MPTQLKNHCSGNSARRRLGKIRLSNRIWAFRDAIAAEIDPPAPDKLEEIDMPRARQANRRKTDAGVGSNISNSFYNHSEFGRPTPGVRMVSVQKISDLTESDD